MKRLAILAGVVVVVLAVGVRSAPAAPLDEVLMPLERYTTAKAKALATAYRAQLGQFYENIYHCLPWVDVHKNGIGFRTPRGATGDDRYLSVWIWIDQNEDSQFSAMSPERRASAMLSRYGVDMLRRMTSLTGIVSDANVQGFSVVLSWLKPGTNGRPGLQPVNETLALFTDKATGLDFLAKKLAGAEFLSRARFSVFDGQQEIGRLPLEVWDDPFVTQFKLKDYEPPKGQHC